VPEPEPAPGTTVTALEDAVTEPAPSGEPAVGGTLPRYGVPRLSVVPLG
jgi:hypothetical protein